ncbi:MAG: putative lipid II flippase FtsW [Chlamydiae bacterium]|nr:putative lipid II flippase FtsW [Chlamydiota bacterium]
MRYLLLIFLGAIFAIGLVMIFSTTSAEVLDHQLNKSTHQALLKQIFYAFIGILLAIGVWRMGYHNLLRFSPALLVLFSILLLLTLIPGIGREVNGSRRWLHLGGFSFQPSEFVKYIVPAYFIQRILALRDTEIAFRDFFRLLLPLGVPLFLILIEPNNGTVGVIVITLVMLCLLTRIPLKYWAIPLLVTALVGGISASQLPYVSGRLKVYINPELDIHGKGHQPHQAKIAAGSGKLVGKGPGNSWQKLSYLPEAQNDYIAAIYAEEFGFLGVLVLILLYMLTALIGFYIANQATDLQGFYLASVVTFLISFQAFMNLGVVSGILPSTGLNLPLFSQGGTSLIANLMGIGLLQSIAKPPLGAEVNP